MPGPSSVNVGVSGSSRRISEIVPPASYAVPRAPPVAATARADGCVNVFVRSSKVDGREVVSVDLQGDGLIKGVVPLQLASELLARAAPATDAGGTRAACVPRDLAQSLFNQALNVAAVDPAVKVTRVGDRWVLAGSREPEPVAKADAPVQLGASRAPIQIVEPQPLPQLAAAPMTRSVQPHARGLANARRAAAAANGVPRLAAAAAAVAQRNDVAVAKHGGAR